MPYVFPYENVFIVGVSLLILVLLIVRVILRKRQQEQEQIHKQTSDSPARTDRQPMV